MDKIKISVEDRTELGKEKVKKLRAAGKLIGNLYGKDIETKSFTTNYDNLYKLLFTANGKYNIFTLDFGKESFDAIPYGIQFHPISKQILHMDFKSVKESEKVKITLPIKPKGVAIGSKKGGALEQKMYELTMKILPTDIMKEVAVDVTNLDLSAELTVKDLVLPASVEVMKVPATQKVFVVVNKTTKA